MLSRSVVKKGVVLGENHVLYAELWLMLWNNSTNDCLPNHNHSNKMRGCVVNNAIAKILSFKYSFFAHMICTTPQ